MAKLRISSPAGRRRWGIGLLEARDFAAWGLGLLLGSSIATAQTGAGYLGFPDLPTAAKAGEYVLVPSYQAIDKAAGPDAAKTTFAYYAQKMVAPGAARSRIAYLSAEREIANSWLIAIPRGGTAKPGDIVLTWWQSGSGMQRAIVVSAADPARPVVRYLDLAFDNPAKAKDKVTPIGQMEEALAADSFVRLSAGAPGSVYRCLDGGSPKRYRLIAKAPNGDLLLLGFAGRLARIPGTQCAPTPLVPKLATGQIVEVEFSGGFTQAKIERVDPRIGRAWVTLYGRPQAIAFGDIVP